MGKEKAFRESEKVQVITPFYTYLFDVMNPYRLEMGLSWSGEHGKDLYQYWKEDLTVHFLNELSETKGDQVLLNLASKEYSKALNLKQID